LVAGVGDVADLDVGGGDFDVVGARSQQDVEEKGVVFEIGVGVPGNGFVDLDPVAAPDDVVGEGDLVAVGVEQGQGGVKLIAQEQALAKDVGGEVGFDRDVEAEEVHVVGAAVEVGLDEADFGAREGAGIEGERLGGGQGVSGVAVS